MAYVLCFRTRSAKQRRKQNPSSSTNQHDRPQCCCKNNRKKSKYAAKKADGLKCLSHYNERFVKIKRPVRSATSPIFMSYPSMTPAADLNKDSSSSTRVRPVLYPIQGSDTTTDGRKVCAIFVGIGCNYRGTANELLTCVNDVNHLFGIWKKGIDLKRCEQVVFTMIDDSNTKLSSDERRFPAQVRSWFQMIRKVRELVQENTRNGILSHITVVYSGHGYFRQTGRSRGEPDGRSESIVLQDGMIWDYEWASEFLWQLPKDTHVVGIFDSCHSGTIWNLEFTNSSKLPTVYQSTQQPSPTSNGPRVWLLSGCRDNQFSLAGQTSYDVSIATRACINVLNKLFRLEKLTSWDSFVAYVQKEVKSLTARMVTSTKQDPAGSVSYLDLTNTALF